MENQSLMSLALLNAKAPFSSSSGKDSLDVALIFGSFEQSLSLFFQGDGVWQLIKEQDATKISMKDYLKTFSAFEFYDIEDIYVCQESLAERGLTTAFHIEDAQVLNRQEFSQKLATHRTVLRF